MNTGFSSWAETPQRSARTPLCPTFGSRAVSLLLMTCMTGLMLCLACTCTAQPCTTGPYWVQLHLTSSPSGRQFHAMAYDNLRQKIILFGGYDTNGTFLGDTWQFDVRGWKQLSPAHHPPARALHSLSSDASRNTIILFGGRDAAAAFDDTWEWNGTDWVQIFPGNSPAPRSGHGMAYDGVRQTHVLFGGVNIGGQELGDTWEYDGNLGAWMLLATGGPAPRHGIQLVYDVPRNRTLLFGGYTSAGATEDEHYLNDTWYWTSGRSAWEQQTPERVPPGLAFYSSAYYGSRASALMQNGQIASRRENTIAPTDLAYLWTGVDWREQPVFQFPRLVRAGAMAYDAAHDRMIYFGGLAFLPDDQSSIFDGTWSLEDKRWDAQGSLQVAWQFPPGTFPDQYQTVRQALNAAPDCTEISIRVGDYSETGSGSTPLVITKSVRLKAFSLFGDPPAVRIH